MKGSKTKEFNNIRKRLLASSSSLSITTLEDDAPASVRIPPWSVEDRCHRSLVRIPHLKVLLASNWTVAFPYLVVLWVVRHYRQDKGLSSLLYVILAFMGCHAVVIVLCAVPHVAYDNKLIDRRVNASIFIAMVLYPYVGLWSLEDSISFDSLWLRQDGDDFAWGPIFPILIYSLMALTLIRDSTWDFRQEVSEVMANPKDPNMPSTALFIVEHNRKARWDAYLCRLLSTSLWDLFPDGFKPSAGGGKFLYQLVSPVCLGMFYLAFNYLVYGLHSLHVMYSKWDEYLVEPCLTDGVQQLEVHVVVWVTFLCISVALRGLLSNPLFLTMTVKDKYMRAERKKAWVKVQCQSKRIRVLWASRGAVLAYIKLHICQHGYPEGKFASGLCWYLYMLVFYSFAAEAILVILMGFQEAERETRLRTPTEFFIRHFSWLPYNTFCQPLGSAINFLFYIVNCEFRHNAPMTEFWGPLLTSQNEFRQWMKKSGRRSEQREFAELFAGIVKLAHNTTGWISESLGWGTDQTEVPDLMKMWSDRLNRMREDNGRAKSHIEIVQKPSELPTDIPFTVFRGTVFPERAIWRHMRQHAEDFVPLMPWERVVRNTCADAKFQIWYPSCKEKVVNLLSEKYVFSKHYEVWMFGIGSIMSPDLPPAGLTNRQKKMMIPYWMHRDAGYRRVWKYRHGTCSITALGLENSDPGEHICGCVYPIDYEKACELFGQREEGYELMMVHEDYFKPMHPDIRMPKGVGYIWMCGRPVSHCHEPLNDACPICACKSHRPTQDSPILQSYVDVVMRGLLFKYRTPGAGHADGMRLAAAFVQTTHGWDAPWFNDRLVVGRPWMFNPAYDIIDGLLSTCQTSTAAFLRRQNLNICRLTTMKAVLLDDQDECTVWARHFFGNTMSCLDEEKREQEIAKNKKTAGELRATARREETEISNTSASQEQTLKELASVVNELSAQIKDMRAEMSAEVKEWHWQIAMMRDSRNKSPLKMEL